MSKNSRVVTLGCRLNSFEASTIDAYMDKHNTENTIVVNTCCVTKEAERQSSQTIRKLKRDNPNAKILVTGCAVEVANNNIHKIVGQENIISNHDKLNIKHYVDNAHGIEEPSADLPYHSQGRTRAFVQIQNGCNHRCSFCIIPATRGPNVSKSSEDIIETISKIVSRGYIDITLTGVDISSWGVENAFARKSNLGLLCKEILASVPDLQRLRLSSLDPALEDSAIIDLLSHEKRFMPYIHLSLQSMNNKVLALMGRRHSKERALEFITQIQNANPNSAIGCDIIAGFPGETEECFLDTKQTLESTPIAIMHVFPYSERPGTVASSLKNSVDVPIRKERAKILRDISSNALNKAMQAKLNSTEQVLIEWGNKGYTENYLPVYIKNNDASNNVGNIITVKITGVSASHQALEGINV